MKDKRREALQELINKKCFLIHEFKYKFKNEELDDYSKLDDLNTFDVELSMIFYKKDVMAWMYHINHFYTNRSKNIFYIIKTPLNDKVIFYRHHMPYDNQTDITYKII